MLLPPEADRKCCCAPLPCFLTGARHPMRDRPDRARHVAMIYRLCQSTTENLLLRSLNQPHPVCEIGLFRNLPTSARPDVLLRTSAAADHNRSRSETDDPDCKIL